MAAQAKKQGYIIPNRPARYELNRWGGGIMTTENTEPDYAGSCFICNGHETVSDDGKSSGITRRNILRGAAFAPVALAGAVGLTASHPTQAATRITPHGEYVVEAGWVLAYQADKLTLLRDASVLVRNDRIEDVRDLPRGAKEE